MAASPTYHLVTSVWGGEYTETFANVTLPCLLAQGNVPSLPAGACTYKIFAPEGDRDAIRNTAAFEALARHARVEFRPITRPDANPYVASSNCYRTATEEAGAAGAVVVYLIPDMILADGALRTVDRHVREGKRAVLVGGMRAVKETLVPEVRRRFTNGAAISAPPRALVELAMAHLHPVMKHHMYDLQNEAFDPSFFCWEIPGEGYVVHCAHLHPVALDLRGERATLHGTIDDDLLFDLALRPDEIAYADDSDNLVWFEISAARRSSVPASGRKLWEILRWLYGATYQHQREYLAHALRIHCRGTESEAWRATEARAAQVIATLLAAFELEKERIGQAPATYALPPTVRIGDEDVGNTASAIQHLMDRAGAVAIADAVAEALEARARSYLARGTTRRLDRSLLRVAAAMALAGAGGSFRALLRLLKRN